MPKALPQVTYNSFMDFPVPSADRAGGIAANTNYIATAQVAFPGISFPNSGVPAPLKHFQGPACAGRVRMPTGRGTPTSLRVAGRLVPFG